MDPRIFESDPTSGGGQYLTRLSHVLKAAGDHNRAHKLAYSVADIHIDSFLTNFSIDYRIAENMIADLVLPVVQVDKGSNKYAKWSREDANKLVDAMIGPRDMPGEISQSLSSDTYQVSPRALWSAVPNDLLISADAPLDLMGQASRDVRGALAKSREKRVADLLSTAGTYTLSRALSGNNRWDVGPSTSTAQPVDDILGAMDLPAVRPNCIVMPQQVWTKFRAHPKVLASVSGVTLSGTVSARVATTDMIKQLFDVEHFLVPNAKARTSVDGASATYDFMWGDVCALLYIAPGTGINQLCFGKTFRHNPLEFSTIYDQRPGMRGVTYIKGAHSDAEKITAADTGYCLDTVIS